MSEEDIELIVDRGGKRINLGRFSSEKTRVALELWHNDRSRPIRCCCTGKKTTLSVYHKKNKFYIRAYPRTKANHQPLCRFFGLPEHLDQDEQYTKRAKKINVATGEIQLRGILPVTVKGVQLDTPEDDQLAKHRRVNKKGVAQYNCITALGLLNELWAGGGLNTHNPNASNPVKWDQAIKKISRWASKVTYNKIALSERLAFLGSTSHYSGQDMFTQVAQLHNTDDTRNNRFYVVCTISDMRPSRFSQEICVNGSNRRIYCKQTLIDTFNRRYPVACKLMTDDNRFHCLALLSCHWSATGKHLSCEQGALLPIDNHCIPFDSRYEYRVSQELVRQRRHFTKPLKMVADEHFLPDFVLLDTDPSTVLEVYGMTNLEEYVAHMEVKNAYYKKNKTPLWTWTPEEQRRIPNFPDKHRFD